MTASCYCKGSELEESLLRWRYTSVPYLHDLLSREHDMGNWITLPFHANEFEVAAKIPSIQSTDR